MDLQELKDLWKENPEQFKRKFPEKAWINDDSEYTLESLIEDKVGRDLLMFFMDNNLDLFVKIFPATSWLSKNCYGLAPLHLLTSDEDSVGLLSSMLENSKVASLTKIFPAESWINMVSDNYETGDYGADECPLFNLTKTTVGRAFLVKCLVEYPELFKDLFPASSWGALNKYEESALWHLIDATQNSTEKASLLSLLQQIKPDIFYDISANAWTKVNQVECVSPFTLLLDQKTCGEGYNVMSSWLSNKTHSDKLGKIIVKSCETNQNRVPEFLYDLTMRLLESNEAKRECILLRLLKEKKEFFDISMDAWTGNILELGRSLPTSLLCMLSKNPKGLNLLAIWSKINLKHFHETLFKQLQKSRNIFTNIIDNLISSNVTRELLFTKEVWEFLRTSAYQKMYKMLSERGAWDIEKQQLESNKPACIGKDGNHGLLLAACGVVAVGLTTRIFLPKNQDHRDLSSKKDTNTEKYDSQIRARL